MHIYVNMPLLMTLSLLTRSFLLTLSGKLLIPQSPFFCGNHLQHSQAETTTPFSVLPLHFSCDMASCGVSHWTTVTCSFVSPAQQSMFKNKLMHFYLLTVSCSINDCEKEKGRKGGQGKGCFLNKSLEDLQTSCNKSKNQELSIGFTYFQNNLPIFLFTLKNH